MKCYLIPNPENMRNNLRSENRKMFLFLPVLIIPCSAFIFATLGGGTESNLYVKEELTDRLNTTLPNPTEGKGGIDKMSIYEIVRRDSLKKSALIDKDPYLEQVGEDEIESSIDAISDKYISFNANRDKSDSETSKENKKQELAFKTEKYSQDIISDIDKIHKRIDRRQSKESGESLAFKGYYEQERKKKSNKIPTKRTWESNNTSGNPSPTTDPEFAEIENMMKQLEKNQGGPVVSEENMVNDDVKMLDKMLDKVLEIQHPERAKQKIMKESLRKKRNLYSVNLMKENTGVSYAGINKYALIEDRIGNTHVVKKRQEKAFYGLTNSEESFQNTIRAVIHETKVIVDKSTVKLRLLDDVYVNGSLIPRNNFVFGICQISNNRLNIIISSIHHKNNIHPVELTAYDIDGIQGVKIPGSIERQIAKQGVAQSSSGFDPGILQTGLITQLTSQAVNITKRIASTNARLIRVELKANYQILLKNNKE